MRTMPGYENAVAAIGEFDVSEFRLVEKMTLQVVEDILQPMQVLELEMRTDRRDPPARIHLRFTGVQDLRIKDWPSGQVEVPGFEVFDIRERQLEGFSWQIRDYEEDVIGFFCRDAEIVSASYVPRE